MVYTYKKQKLKINKTAQKILDARALYPDSTMVGLYEELTMLIDLRRAHQENDRAVMNSYGMEVGPTAESDAIAHLL